MDRMENHLSCQQNAYIIMPYVLELSPSSWVS